MIKKITFFTTLIFCLFTAGALADGAGPPVYDGAEVAKIDMEMLSKNITIGENLEFELTISNMSRKSMQLSYGYMDGTCTYVYGLDVADENGKLDGLVIAPKETVELIVSAPVGHSPLEWYKVDDEFYVDIRMYLEFYTEDENDITYYEIAGEEMTMKIDNILYDHNLYEINWLDTRDTMYYSLSQNYIADDEIELLLGRVAAEMYIDSFGAEKRQPEDDEIIKRWFRDGIENGDMPVTTEYTYSTIYECDDKYYYLEKSREYKAVYLDKPEISITVKPADVQSDENTDIYDLFITNQSNVPIENFYINTPFIRKYGQSYTEYTLLTYTRYGTLGTDDEWHVRAECKNTNSNMQIYVGYHMDEICHIWSMFSSLPIEDEEILGMDNYADYAFACSQKLAEAVQYPNIDDFEILFAEPTPMPTAESVETASKPLPTKTPKIQSTSAPKATVSVKRRYNAVMFGFVVIGLLMIGAGVMVVISLKNIIKDKKEKEDSND